MKQRYSSILTVYFLTLLMGGLLLGDIKPAGADSSIQEIQVTLFGQPCTMSGPYSKQILFLVHDISPEKTPPLQPLEQMKKVRAKAMTLKGVSTQIETYRDHLRKRLSAKIAFEEAIGEAKKAPKGNSSLKNLLVNIKEHIDSSKFRSFENETKSLFEKNAEKWNESLIDSIREKYEPLIQPDTEEEFHKAIRLSKVQYVCAFDEGSDENSADEPDEVENENEATPSKAVAPTGKIKKP